MQSWVSHLYGTDIRSFVARWARRSEPIATPVVPSLIVGDRAAATYAAHPYWSKKPHELLHAGLAAFTRPGDVVLDPFAGSGGLPLLAARRGRAAIAIDRSPAAAFIIDGISRIPRGTDVRASVEEVVLSTHVEEMFRTCCHRCGGRARTLYAVWQDVVMCRMCGAETATGSHCGCATEADGWIVGSRIQQIDAACLAGCRPARFRRDARSLDAAAHWWQSSDIPSALRHRGDPPGAPRRLFPAGVKTGEIFKRGIQRVDQMYTPRNLRAMAAVRSAIDGNSTDERAAPRLAWHAALLGTSLKAQHVRGGGGYLPGMYYVPRVRKERNPAVTLNRVAGRLAAAAAAYEELGAGGALIAGIGDARDLGTIPTSSIDYVFLDPPYDGKVQYAELNFLWESWLGATDDWGSADLVVNAARGQLSASWYEGIRRVVDECSRVLKPGAWLTLTCVPSTSLSLAPVLAHAGMAGLIHHTELDGTVVNRQKTFAQRTGGSTVRDQVMHFQREWC